MHRPISRAFSAVILAGLLASCDDTETPGPSEPEPVSITEGFLGQLTVNGGITFPFSATRAGTIEAKFSSLAGDGTVVGLSLGTWNGQTCALIITNDNATAATTVVGTASNAGAFCVRVYDVGKLTEAVDFEVLVTHF